MNQPYKAIRNSHGLRNILGNGCSSEHNKSYVIGPDLYGRICHCATCSSYEDAQDKAEELNALHDIRVLSDSKRTS